LFFIIPYIINPKPTAPHTITAATIIIYSGHHDEKCSFDAIIEKYNLEDRALQELAKIVRGADTDQPDPPPESIGLEAIAEGFRQITKDDFDNISKQFYVYDALYAYCSTK
jgi:hypothetical protein